MGAPFDDVLAANDAYAASFALGALGRRPARGLAVLTCMDARIEPLAAFGLEPGDAAVMRNAGGRVTADVVRSLLIARGLLGVERLIIVGHTGCGLTAASDDELRQQLRVAGTPVGETVELLAVPDPAAAVRGDVEKVRLLGSLAGLEVAGFVYDVDSGRLREI